MSESLVAACVCERECVCVGGWVSGCERGSDSLVAACVWACMSVWVRERVGLCEREREKEREPPGVYVSV